MTNGDYFGEIAILTDLKRTATVYTISNCYLGMIEKTKFIKLVQNNNMLHKNLMLGISKYNDDLFKELKVLINNVPPFRSLKSASIRKIILKVK